MANTDSRISSARPLTIQQSIISAREFQGSGTWIVDNYNCLAALLALADKQPKKLYLIARDDTEEDMPREVFEEISKRAQKFKGDQKCGISIRFIDSFLKPCGTITDRQRLELLMASGRFTFDRFYGYLGSEVVLNPISRLVGVTLVSFGLAIKNAVDAALVSNLELECVKLPLKHLNISVSSEVAVKDLKPLHASFGGKQVYLTFPYLTDANVENVEPAIYALTTGRDFAGIFFPKSRVTGAGARRLASQLDEVVVTEVSIEPCETWKQDQKEKESIEELLKRVERSVVWNVDWMYKVSRN